MFHNRMLAKSLLIVFGLCVAVATGIWITTDRATWDAAKIHESDAQKFHDIFRKFPDEAKFILENADQFELSSLAVDWNSRQADIGWGDSILLGTTVIDDVNDQKKLVAVLYRGIEERTGLGMCFQPSHEIRAVKDGRTVVFTIGFECSRIHVSVGGTTTQVGTSKYPEPLLDEFLRKANIPLAPKSGDE